VEAGYPGSPSGRSGHRSPQPPLAGQPRRVPVPPWHRHDVTLSRHQAAQVHIVPVRDQAGAAAAVTAEDAGPHGHSEQAARSPARTPGTRTEAALRKHPSCAPSEPPPAHGSGTAGVAVTSLTVSYGRRRRVVPAPCGWYRPGWLLAWRPSDLCVVTAFMELDVSFSRSGNRHYCLRRGVPEEEFRKQGPCRFGRSASVAGGITDAEPGVARRREVLGYRKTPAGPRRLRPRDDLRCEGMAAARGRM
jgi:hypothetical protein